MLVAAAVLIPSVAVLHAMDSTSTSTSHEDANEHNDHDTNHTGDHDDNETSDDNGIVHAEHDDTGENETETD